MKIYRNSVIYKLNISGMEGAKNVTFFYHCSRLHTYTMPLSVWESLKEA